jgi:hypothetical protein
MYVCTHMINRVEESDQYDAYEICRCMCIHMFVYVYMYVYIYAYKRLNEYVRIQVYIYT